MAYQNAQVEAARLMSEFAQRTGLPPAAETPRRYLWTDAFAVCNFIELFERTQDQRYLQWSTELIDQVHWVLGRFRDDDMRSGWISGLSEEAGRHHPTAGGLRIGKELREREPSEPVSERLEWERDGQYFHYLTKWMHALSRAAATIGEPDYVRWVGELAKAAFGGFARRSASGEVVGIYWKMSTDLSRPLVASTGLHDALDGYISYRELAAASRRSRIGEVPALDQEIEALAPLCRGRDWTTDDPLGLGGLLFDAGRLLQLTNDEQAPDILLADEILTSCVRGLGFAGHYTDQAAEYRLAFRELGLAIGLQAVSMIAENIPAPRLQGTVDALRPYLALGEEIAGFWLPPDGQDTQSWRAHRDINEVMLATALAPDTFLSV